MYLLAQKDLDEITGGAQLNGSFLSENLVDEIYLTLTAQLFGQGTPLADGFELHTELELVEAQTLEGGTVLLHYTVVK